MENGYVKQFKLTNKFELVCCLFEHFQCYHNQNTNCTNVYIGLRPLDHVRFVKQVLTGNGSEFSD